MVKTNQITKDKDANLKTINIRKDNLRNTKEKVYIFKYIKSRVYLENIIEQEYVYTFDIDEAKRFNGEEIKSIGMLENLEVVEYEKEKYEAAEERYMIHIEVMAEHDEYDILSEDLGQIKNKNNNDFIKLFKKYPDNRLLNELSNIIYKKENNIVMEVFDFDYKAQIEIIKNYFVKKYIEGGIEDETICAEI